MATPAHADRAETAQFDDVWLRRSLPAATRRRGFRPFTDAGGWRGTALARLPEGPRRFWWPEIGEPKADDWIAVLDQARRGLAGDWRRFKDDPSGRVAGGTVRLGARELAVVAKSPRPKRLSQALADLFRASRAKRAWRKTWRLIDAGLPMELPLLVAEQRVAGRVKNQLGLYAAVPGEVVYHMSLSALDLAEREAFFARVGRVLAATSGRGFAHVDAKTVNWIASKHLGQTFPIMLDADGVSKGRPGNRIGLERFLRALKLHPEATGADAAAVVASFDAAAD